ncbi:uncharacterized protein LOC111343718 [Stylophora pistillata]|uniref:uncharacterized protein LOC111343718 n=1 Tax=Stylophora pistillata TaxID=50429 RepID=UPI000C04B070|nr:uncharacterized protein LOC111343718 [Stylophora pistillata]
MRTLKTLSMRPFSHIFNRIILILCILDIGTVFSKEIYVSRCHGNSQPSCGGTMKTACKLIALGIAHAQWNDTISIDGTETSRDPYPCLPTTSQPDGIYVNKSLSLRRFGKAKVFIKCSSLRRIILDGSNTSDTVTIYLDGLTFIDSCIAVRMSTLNVVNCNFIDATSLSNAAAVVDFKTFDGNHSLLIAKSVFSNNSLPCISVVGNNLKIEVYDTVFTGNNASESKVRMVDVAVFMISVIRMMRYPSSMTFNNVSFIRNFALNGGCLHVKNADNVNASARYFNRNRANYKDLGHILQAHPKDHNSFHSTLEYISVSVSEGMFLHNFGGAIIVGGNLGLVDISVVNCDFINNSSPLSGGAMLVESSREFRLQIKDCKFVQNSARNEGSAIYILAVDFKVAKGFLLVENVSFQRNILRQPNFIEDVPLGGTLTICVESAYLQVNLVNVSFWHNKVDMGSSTLHLDARNSEVTIVDCNFHGNSQDERFPCGWTTILIFSIQLKFTLNRTSFSENIGSLTADNNTLAGQPVNFFVGASYVANITISGLLYRNNSGGGMLFKLGSNDVSSSTFSLGQSIFESNKFFSMEIRASTGAQLVIRQVNFTANKFESSVLQSLALLFFYIQNQGSKVKIEEATFKYNSIQGRILLFRLPPDQKDPLSCKIPRWIYRNYIQLFNATFDGNSADTSVVRLENGHNNLSNSQFVDNLAIYTLFASEGSTSLELVDTSFDQTKNWQNGLAVHIAVMVPSFTGFIYWASSGPIQLSNTTLSVESSQDIDAYFMVTGASEAKIDDTSVIQCPVGTLRKKVNLAHSHFVSNEACPNGLYNTMSESFILSCKQCSPGFYSVEPFATKCRPCPFGANCTTDIAAKPTFWGFPLLSDHGTVGFQGCPTGYCCPYLNVSCPYDNQGYLLSGCSGNRTGFLCGQCKTGYTETLFSPQCTTNDECEDHWFWSVVLFYSLTFAFLLVWKYPVMCFIQRILPWKITTHKRDASPSSPNGGGYIKVVFYFYQVANLVFMSEAFEIHLEDNYLLTPILGWFDFKAISSSKTLICPIRGLTVASKIFLEASQVLAVLVGVLVIFLFHGTVRKINKQSPIFPPSGQYLSATTECLLLGYSALAKGALKALNCVEIQSTIRFFYDGNVQCWCWWQKLCGVFLLVFIIPFVFVLYLGSRLLNSKIISPGQFVCGCTFPLPFAVMWVVKYRRIFKDSGAIVSSNEETPLRHSDSCNSAEQSSPFGESLDQSQAHSCNLVEDVVYGPFRKSHEDRGAGAVYWESVLIARRLVMICLHTFIVFPFIRIFCLSVTCAAILAYHLWKKPFQDSRVNHAETASLAALLLLAIINMADVVLGINDEVLSAQEQICMTVLHIVEIIILGTVPLAFALLIVVSVLWRLFEFIFKSLAGCCKSSADYIRNRNA